jgi:hypothetical protein
MIDRDEDGYSKSSSAAKRHLEESLASGRITQSEAGVIAQFFAAAPSLEWPSSGLQRRMQASGGPEPVGARDRKDDLERKS